ncbi:MAG: hypothetical protein ACFFAE_17480 [Candidatus Hodarchaeota archaeon]
MVRPGRESFKRFISTIVDLLPPYIEKYPQSDQLLLREFLTVLRHYGEADYQRNKLSQRFREYYEKLLETDQYLQTAFLWFTYNYFSNANMLLNISKFHANFFYEYLVKHLRGSSTNLGVFGLIRKNVALKDLAWEQLQYESNKLLIPLTNDQLQILKTVYLSLLKEGVYTLDSRKLKDIITNQVEFPSKIKSTKELTRFFSLVDAQWFYRFFLPAFGLDCIIFHFQLQESSSLKDVIDFHNPENTLLCMSDVFLVRNSPKTYIGRLRVPSRDFGHLKVYLRKCERQAYLILKKLVKVMTRSLSGSLTHYRANSGWFEQSPTKNYRLKQLIQSQNPKKKQKEFPSLFFQPQCDIQWHYKQHPFPIEIIRLFSKLSPHFYSFTNLPLRLLDLQDSYSLSRVEIGLLKQLYYNQVVQIGFVPLRLVFEFSLDEYCVILPKITLFQLKRFLDLIPFSEIDFTENFFYIWARLTPKLAQWIESELKWPIIPIRRIIFPQNPESSYYNPSKLQWRTPNILKG